MRNRNVALSCTWLLSTEEREREREKDRELRVRAKWIRFVYQRTLWPNKPQEGWTRCPTVVLLWLKRTHTLTLCMHHIQMHAWQVRERWDARTCWRRQQRGTWTCDYARTSRNNNSANTRRCSLFCVLLSSICSNQAQPYLAGRRGQLLAACLLSKLKWDISWAK